MEVAFSPDGQKLAVSDYTAGAVVLVELATQQVLPPIKLRGPVSGVVWRPDSRALYAAEYQSRTIAEIATDTRQVLRRFVAGPGPLGLALMPKRDLLLVANSLSDGLSVIDLRTGEVKAPLPLARMPRSVAVAPDETVAVAGNFLPEGSAAEPDCAASVSVIDLRQMSVRATVRLPAGATLVRQVAISPDGQWTYVAHIIGRFNQPLTQLERGWMIGNAISIVDLRRDQLYATVLLDQINQGATYPWGLCLSARGDTLWTTLSSVHRLAELKLSSLHLLLAGSPDAPYPAQADSVRVWEEIRQDPQNRRLLINDLDALPKAELLRNHPLTGQGPRGLALSPDGRRLAVGMYYSGTVLLLDAQSGKIVSTLSLGNAPPMDELRRGEMVFHDATVSLQQWLSCSTCHPDARMDGLNWDLVNDGLGNPKNTRSMLLSHRTPPVMSLGIRANMEIAVASGFHLSLFGQPSEAELNGVRAYLRSLQPEPSPFRLRDGSLTEKARRGQELFASTRTGCAGCHPSPLFTDLQLHDVGTHRAPESPSEFDTPTLVEVWRTAPYLHHGAATNLLQVLTTLNPKQQHGSTAHLTADELNCLVEYVLSL